MDFYNLLKEDQDVILEMVDLFNPLCSDEKPYMNYEVFYMWGCEVDEEDEEDVVYGGHEYKINKTSDDDLMSYICCEGKLVALKYLIEEKNADFRSLDSLGSNLLSSAARGGRPDVLFYLLKSGLDPNHQDKEGTTPLMDAVKHCNREYHRSHDHLECVEILIEAGANVRMKDKCGRDAMEFAESSGIGQILEDLERDHHLFEDFQSRWIVDKESALLDYIKRLM